MPTYAYQLVTAPATSAISDAEMEAHARATGQPSEQYVPYVAAAQAYVERVTDRKLISQTWKAFMDAWPSGDRIAIPFGQLTAVAHVKYTDTAAATTTWASTNYEVSTARDPGVLALAYGKSWPTATLRTLDPIEIQFTCGWATAADVPADIRSAILLIAAHLYEHREEVVLSDTGSVDTKAIELGSRALLANWRLT